MVDLFPAEYSGSRILHQSFQITQSVIKQATSREETYSIQGTPLNLLHAMIVNQRIFLKVGLW